MADSPCGAARESSPFAAGRRTVACEQTANSAIDRLRPSLDGQGVSTGGDSLRSTQRQFGPHWQPPGASAEGAPLQHVRSAAPTRRHAEDGIWQQQLPQVGSGGAMANALFWQQQPPSIAQTVWNGSATAASQTSNLSVIPWATSMTQYMVKTLAPLGLKRRCRPAARASWPQPRKGGAPESG
jgi:hypothetical protein